MTAASRPSLRAIPRGASDHPLLGWLLEWVVNSVEDARARLYRGSIPRGSAPPHG